MKKDANTSIETCTKSNVFKTQSIACKDLSASFSWGFGVTNLNGNNLPYPVAIYKDASSTAHRTYNTLNFVFRVAEAAVAAANLAIKIEIAPGNGIMQSLTENLPNATGQKVYCYYITSPAAAIQCKNVGRLLAS